MKRALASALLALGLACQSASDGPTDPIWGKQACSSCAMLIGEPRFAAQLLTAAGDHLYFDDVGCLAAFLVQRKIAVKRAWVRDIRGSWVSPERARFSNGARTPMDYGFEFSETGDLSWNAIVSAVRERATHGSER